MANTHNTKFPLVWSNQGKALAHQASAHASHGTP